jgi:flavodoxin
MKTLIAFYSLTGNVKKIALSLVQATGGELLEIKPKKDIPAKGFMKYMIGGHQAIKKETPELVAFDTNPGDFDLIFIGTPDRASNFAPAIRSFLVQAKLQNKKIALFCSHGGDNDGGTLAKLEKELAGNEIAGKIDFKMDGISADQINKNLEAAKSWAQNLIGK